MVAPAKCPSFWEEKRYTCSISMCYTQQCHSLGEGDRPWERDHPECLGSCADWARVFRCVDVPEGESRFPLQGPKIQRHETDTDVIIRDDRIAMACGQDEAWNKPVVGCKLEASGCAWWGLAVADRVTLFGCSSVNAQKPSKSQESCHIRMLSSFSASLRHSFLPSLQRFQTITKLSFSTSTRAPESRGSHHSQDSQLSTAQRVTQRQQRDKFKSEAFERQRAFDCLTRIHLTS